MDSQTRITQLENCSRRWRWGTAGFGIVVASAWTLGLGQAGVPETIRARRFEVIGEDGSVLVTVGQQKSNGAIVVASSDGRKAVEVSVHPQWGFGGLVTVYGKNDDRAITLESYNGFSNLRVWSDDKEKIRACANERGAGELTVADAKGIKQVYATVDAEGGWVLIRSNRQSSRFPAGVVISTLEGKGQLRITDANGSALVALPPKDRP